MGSPFITETACAAATIKPSPILPQCGAYKLYIPLPDEAQAQIIRQARNAAKAFRQTWAETGQMRRLEELSEHVMTYAQFKAFGGYDALLTLTAEQSLALFIQYTCINQGYINPNKHEIF